MTKPSGLTALTSLFLTLLLLMGTAAASASSLEESYWRARDAGKAEMARRTAKGDPSSEAFNDKALAGLKDRLAAIIGPITFGGHPPTYAAPSIKTLGDGEMADLLDGMEFVPREPGPPGFVIITTRPLLSHWLHEDRARFPAFAPPEAIPDALRSPAFYGHALCCSGDAFDFAAILDIAKPAGVDFAFAVVSEFSPGAVGPTDLTFLVTLVKGDRIEIAGGAPPVKLSPIAACDAQWKKQDADAAKLDNDRAYALRLRATHAWTQCWRDNAKNQPFYSSLVAKVQRIAKDLARP